MKARWIAVFVLMCALTLVGVAGATAPAPQATVSNITASSFTLGNLACGTRYVTKLQYYDAANKLSSVQTINTTTAACPATLTVTRAGTGTGTVTSSPAGINCGTDCTESYTNGTAVTLSVTPDAGSTFAGWSGACTSDPCVVTMSANKTATATFTLIPPPAQCADGIDNDGDLLIDFPNDPGCASASDNDETDAPAGTIYWRGDYETGNFGQWSDDCHVQSSQVNGVNNSCYPPSSVGDGNAAIQTTTTQHGSGYAATYTVRPYTSNTTLGGNRAEVLVADPSSQDPTCAQSHACPGQEAWYHFAFYIPGPSQTWTAFNCDWNVITDWHSMNNATGGPQIGVNNTGGDCRTGTPRTGARLYVEYSTDLNYYDIQQLQYDHWYDGILHAVWSTTSSGSFQTWIDGVAVTPQVSMTTLANSTGDYWKEGFYRHQENLTNTVIHDGACVGDSMAIVQTC